MHLCGPWQIRSPARSQKTKFREMKFQIPHTYLKYVIILASRTESEIIYKVNTRLNQRTRHNCDFATTQRKQINNYNEIFKALRQKKSLAEQVPNLTGSFMFLSESVLTSQTLQSPEQHVHERNCLCHITTLSSRGQTPRRSEELRTRNGKLMQH